MEIPKFNLKVDITEEEAQVTETQQRGGNKFFEPGTYTLAIKSAEFHKTMDGDPTWIMFKITLGLENDEREFRTMVSIPTAHIQYRKPGMQEKHQLLFFHKLRAFFRAIGESPEVGALAGNVKRLFSDPAKLVGKQIGLQLGFKKNHVARTADGVYQICTPKGVALFDETFADRDSAKIFGAENGMDLDKVFCEVLKFIPQPTTKADANDDWT